MSLLIDKTIREFNDLLASNEPAPGGGSTAALSGLLGSALSMMVVNLSFGKKSYEALEDSIKDKVILSFKAIEILNRELMELVDEDTRAFNSYMKAVKLSKDTEEERTVRTETMQKASLYTLEVPIKVAEKCLGILENQLMIAQYGNRNAVSDVGVGALLALAGLEGAILNVRINLPGINDVEVKSGAEEKIERYLNEGRDKKARIIDFVNQRINVL
jgi:Methenyl tetrahydrofolate cyclohydrolase